MFEGKKVRLRGIRPDDWEHFVRWDEDSDAQRYGWQVWPPYGEDGAKEYAKTESAKKPTDGNNRYIIETLDGEVAGSMNVRVDQRRFNFEYGISVDRQYWGHGYAQEAIELACRYLFGELRMHKGQAWVYSFNTRSASMHRKFGMTLEGTIREGQFTDGRFWDIYIFGITADEFFARFGRTWGDLPE